ncbi:hypothetical protein CWE13_06970 [Aliidiomarina shirensis]|uniref:SURF1-like protein n=1 Tax=Aliidiomarina shirensis TaxID=1048642 RepID=A0A432WV86_9GAMM|nr:SURF1 family protein [Aliidiomarina shirensis]RUO37684.1 hypothetical protein CWE13_06970 [Aliidiomarina shirensis]
MKVLRLGSLLFRIHIGAMLITLLAIAVMVKLGFWQIDRGQEKQMIMDRHAAAENYSSITLDSLDSLASSPDEKVSLRATLHPEYLFYIDNQIQQGRAGYHVLALATNAELSPWLIPVNLGWIPAGQNRADIPQIEMATDEIEVFGRVRIPADSPFILQEQQFNAEDWPMRIQYPELAKMREQLQLPLADFIVLQSPDADIGFVRDWPVVVMTPHRHYAYAVQWFGLALAALIIFLVASRHKPKSAGKENS